MRAVGNVSGMRYAGAASVPPPVPAGAVGGATMSDDGVYRYELRRSWPLGVQRTVVWVMLNPSTADAIVDDPTIRRVIAISKHLTKGIAPIDCSDLVVVNLFAFRATAPAELVRAMRHGADVIGPDNDRYLAHWLGAEEMTVIAAWGAQAGRSALSLRAEQVARMRGSAWWCLDTTREGHPRHPLYTPAGAALRRWNAHQVYG